MYKSTRETEKQYNTVNLMCADNIKVPETVDEVF